MADTILKVDNINVYYGNIHAVKGVSFEVNEGSKSSPIRSAARSQEMTWADLS